MCKKLLSFLLIIFFTSAASAGNVEESEVIVSVDGVQITTDDVRRYIAERIASGVPTEAFSTSKGMSQTVENILSLRRLGKMARDAGFVSNDQIEWEVALYRERLQHREWARSLIDKEMLATDWDAAAREEYIANRDSYQVGSEQVRASHVLIGTEDRSEEDAKLLAERVLKEAKSGADFAGLVEKYSDDPSAEQNKGDLGFFGRGRMVPAFEEAAFNLSGQNNLSSPVKTNFGYHVIKFVEKREPKKLTFEEAKEDIIVKLKASAQTAIRNRLTMEARSVSTENAVINDETLKKLEQTLREK